MPIRLAIARHGRRGRAEVMCAISVPGGLGPRHHPVGGYPVLGWVADDRWRVPCQSSFTGSRAAIAWPSPVPRQPNGPESSNPSGHSGSDVLAREGDEVAAVADDHRVVVEDLDQLAVDAGRELAYALVPAVVILAGAEARRYVGVVSLRDKVTLIVMLARVEIPALPAAEDVHGPPWIVVILAGAEVLALPLRKAGIRPSW
jgi:hypothetical protein